MLDSFLNRRARGVEFSYYTTWLVEVEFNAPLDTILVISEAVFTASHLTDTDKQIITVEENTDKQTQYKSEKVNNVKYSKTKLHWFSCLLQHSARKRGWGLFYDAAKPTRGYYSTAFAG